MPGPWLFCQVVRSLPGGPSSLPGPGPARVGTPRPCEQLASSAGLSAGELTPRAPAAPASVDPSLQDLAGTRGGVAGGTFLDSSRPIRPLLLTPLGCCEGGGICSAVRDPPGRQLKLAARQYPSCKPLRTPHGSVGTTPLQEDFLGAKGEVVGFSQRVGAVSTPRGAGPQGLRHSCCRSTMTRLPSCPGPKDPKPQENVISGRMGPRVQQRDPPRGGVSVSRKRMRHHSSWGWGPDSEPHLIHPHTAWGAVRAQRRVA